MEKNNINYIFRNIDMWLEEKNTNVKPPFLYELQQLIYSSNRYFFDSIKTSKKKLYNCINFLLILEEQSLVYIILNFINFSHTDNKIKKFVVNEVLKGKIETIHKWVFDYNVLEQKITTINNLLLPYVEKNFKEKKLFVNLKKYELSNLQNNKSVIDYDKLIRIIKNSKEVQKSSKQRLIKKSFVKIHLPIKFFQTLLHLSWSNEKFLVDLCSRYNKSDFIDLINSFANIQPVYLMVSELGYPMGGGESFMHQTSRILCEFGINSIWVSFKNNDYSDVKSESITQTPYYVDIRTNAKDKKKFLSSLVTKYSVDLIHSHGGTNDLARDLSKELNILCMIGYHFWSGLINLGPTFNQNILRNINKHELNSNDKLNNSPLIHKYVASDFMLDVYKQLGGKDFFNIIYPVTDRAQYFVERRNFGSYVLQLNLTKLKGGEIFYDCMRALGKEIPFLGVQSEHDQSDFYELLKDESLRYKNCKITSYTDVKKLYKDARIVIIPTLVDETFCRVAFESAANGIPVLSTNKGFLKDLLGSSGIFLSDDSNEWISKIKELYNKPKLLKEIGEKQKKHVMSFFGDDFRNFLNISLPLINNSTQKNICIFTIWGDQGLGNLARAYSESLRRLGCKVHIFSFQSYSKIKYALKNQENESEWSIPNTADSVYYSYNNRENVTLNELTQFIFDHKIKKLIVPEVCWEVNWQRLFNLMSKNTIQIFNVPMLEIVIDHEILNHNKLTATLFSTKVCKSILETHGVTNGIFLGFGCENFLNDNSIQNKLRKLKDSSFVKFIHVAGHNPNVRKNTSKVINAFSLALSKNKNIELTITSMDPINTYYKGVLPEKINIIDKPLSRSEILTLYESHDVSIQVPSHEGIGLGFYETLSRGTPVITLNCPPCNEIIKDGQTGWLIPASPIKIHDNPNAIVPGYDFENGDLAEAINEIKRKDLELIIANMKQYYHSKFDKFALSVNFLTVLSKTNFSMYDNHIGENLVQSNKIKFFLLKKIKDKFANLNIFRNLYLIFRKLIKNILKNIYKTTAPLRKILILKFENLLNKILFNITVDIHDMKKNITNLKDQIHFIKDQIHFIKDQNHFIKDQNIHIRHNSSFIKEKYSTFISNDSLLTYLKCESPIYVNPNDIGCPSAIINDGEWEPENLNVLLSFLKPESVFVDIGANVGYFSITLGNRLRKWGKVIAIEPNKNLTNLLEKSIHLNSLEKTVDIHQLSLSHKKRKIKLYYPEDHLGRASETLINKKNNFFNSNAYPLDEIIPSNVIVDLIKIDVEGNEYDVLLGMKNILKRCPNVKILFEKIDKKDSLNIEKFLKEFNFSLYGIGDFSFLKSLNSNQFNNFTGYILAANSEFIETLDRNFFVIYPRQLSENLEFFDNDKIKIDNVKNDLAINGSLWNMKKGHWVLTLKGSIKGIINVMIISNSITLKVGSLSSSNLEFHFILDYDCSACELKINIGIENEIVIEKIILSRLL